MGKVLMPIRTELSIEEFIECVADSIEGKDFGHLYVVGSQLVDSDKLIVVMDDNSEFEIVCRKKIT